MDSDSENYRLSQVFEFREIDPPGSAVLKKWVLPPTHGLKSQQLFSAAILRLADPSGGAELERQALGAQCEVSEW